MLPRAVLRPRLLVPLAALAAAALPVLSIAAPAEASTTHYVALGDSYSSGVGAGDYYSNSGSCDRSPNAYSQLWDNAHAPAAYASVACSGATTSDVVSSQVPALSASTSLVSITIGGNDVGFSSVMETCVIDSTSSCVSAVDNAENEIANQLPGELNNALSAIASHAPNARVVVLDYPELYDLSQSSGCVGLSTTDRTDLNQAADQLDAQEAAAAGRYGDTFGDVRSHFAGHEICDSDSYLHSVNWFDIDESYHPTAEGQADGYYPVLNALAGS